MATILVTSVAGSPGVSTTALALTMSWPRPVLMIEADILRYSAVMAGYFRGQMKHTKGMGELPVAVRSSSEGLTVHHLLGHSIALDAQDQSLRKVVPGFRDPAAASSWQHLWGPLGMAAAALEQSGADVIIDAGRWTPKDPRAALFTQADQVLLLVPPDLPSLVAAHHRVPELRRMTDAVGRDDALLVATAATAHTGAYGSREASKALGLEIMNALEWDPRTAAVFSQGESQKKPFRSTKLGRSTLALQNRLISRLNDRRKLMHRPTEYASTR